MFTAYAQAIAYAARYAPAYSSIEVTPHGYAPEEFAEQFGIYAGCSTFTPDARALFSSIACGAVTAQVHSIVAAHPDGTREWIGDLVTSQAGYYVCYAA